MKKMEDVESGTVGWLGLPKYIHDLIEGDFISSFADLTIDERIHIGLKTAFERILKRDSNHLDVFVFKVITYFRKEIADIRKAMENPRNVSDPENRERYIRTLNSYENELAACLAFFKEEGFS